jgi:bacteriorhodopsin
MRDTEGTTRTRRGNGLAIAGFVCSLVGTLFLWIVLAPLGIIFGSVGLSRARHGAPHRGLAIAAIVIGVLDIVAYLVLTIAVLQDGGGFSGFLG